MANNYYNPEEFADEMIRIRKECCDDPNVKCRDMLEFMCYHLVNLGYEEGVDIFLDVLSEVEHEY